jgi:glutamine amidotransferase
MCELLAMSSRHPTTVTASFAEVALHGGVVGPHRDGWGLASYEGADVRLFREPAAAGTSACVRFLQDHPVAATLVVGHVRRATQGAPALANSQPFVRELGGRMHVFAHNGDLAGSPALVARGACRPVGDTDSERAFCALLERLRGPWQDAEGVPPLPVRLAIVSAFAATLRELGPANFVYSDGDALFVHGHRRQQGGGLGVRPPGLHLLCRRCAAEGVGDEPQDVVLVASVPLTGEAWQPLEEGEIVVMRSGRRVAST